MLVWGLAAWLASSSGNEWVRQRLEAEVTAIMGEGRLRIGGLHTRLVDGLRLTDVTLEDGSGRAVIALEGGRVQLVPQLAQRRVRVDLVGLDGLRFDLQLDQDGLLDVNRMFPSSDEESAALSLPWPLELDKVQLDHSAFAYSTPEGPVLALEALSLDASGQAADTRWDLSAISGYGRLTEPDLGPFTLDGGLTWRSEGGLDLHKLLVELTEANTRARVSGAIDYAPELIFALDLEGRADPQGLERAFGELGLVDELDLDLRAEGPLSALAVTGAVTPPKGSAELDLVLDLESELPTWSGEIRPDQLDLSFVEAVTEPTVLTGSMQLDGHGFAWPEEVGGAATIALEEAIGWGYRIPGAHAQVRIEDGQLKLQRVVYEAEWGRVIAKGRLTEALIDVDVEAEIWDLSGLSEFGAEGLHGAADAQGRFTADWSSEPLTASFDGDLLAREAAYEDQVSVQRYVGPVHFRYDEESTAVWAEDAELTEIDASGVTLALATGNWEVELDRELNVVWRAELDAAGAAVSELAAEGVSGLASGYVRRDGALLVEADLGLFNPSLERFTAQRGIASVVLRDEHLEFDLDVFTGPELVAALSGEADLEARAFDLDVVQLGATSGVAWTNDAPVHVVLTPDYDGAEELTLALSSVAGSLALGGQMGLTGPLAGEIQVKRLALSYLSSLYPELLAGYVGSLDLDLTLSGTAAQPEILGEVGVLGLLVPAQVWGLGMDAHVHVVDDLIKVQGRADDLEGPLLSFRASVPAHTALEAFALSPRQPVQGELLLQPVDTQRLRDAFPAASELPEGRLSAQLVLGGTLLDPQLEVKAGLELAAGDPAEFLRADLDLGLRDGHITLKLDGRDRGVRILKASGTAKTRIHAVTAWLFEAAPEPDLAELSTWVDELDVSVIPMGVPTDLLGRFVELPREISGRVSGAVAIRGRPDQPEVGGGLQLSEGRIGEVIVSPAVLGLAPAEGGYTVFGTFGLSQGDSGMHMLNLSGYLPLVLNLDASFDMDQELAREGLSLDITGDGLPLGVLVLVDPGIRNTSGVLDVEGRIVGSLADPRPELNLELQDGRLEHVDYQVAFEDLQLRARAAGGRLAIGRFDFSTRSLVSRSRGNLLGLDLGLDELGGLGRGGAEATELPCVGELGLRPGATSIRGHAALNKLALGQVDVAVCASEAWFSSTDDMVLQLGADVTMVGPWPELDVRGRARSENVQMVFDESFFLNDRDLSLDPIIEILRPSHEVRRAAAPEPPFYWPWDIQLDIDLNRSTSLSVVVPFLDAYGALGLTNIRLEKALLTGVMDFRMHEDDIDILGEVSTLHGTIEVVNSDFDLQDGTITFAGDDYLNPTLDLHATRIAGTYGLIEVIVQQTVDQPVLEFRADNSAFTTTDILSILLIGRPATSSGQSGGGLPVLTGLVTNQLEEAAGSLSGRQLVDSLSIDAGSQAAVGAVRFGWQVGNRGYLELAWRNSAELTDESATNFDVTLDWVINRRLQAELSLNEQAAADVFATWRF